MRRILWLPVVVVVPVLILLGMNQGKEPGALPGNAVDSSGGVISAFNGAVKLDFPSGALSGKTTISVREASAYADASRMIPGTVYEFGPNGTKFLKPVLLSIKYDLSSIPAGTNENALRIVVATSSLRFANWVAIANSTVDTATKTVIAPINGFSTYGLTAESDLVSDDYKGFMENPSFKLSGTVVVNPSPSVICEPGGELYVEAVYTDAEGKRPESPIYIWYLEAGTGSMQEALSPDMSAAPYKWMPSEGVIILKAPADAAGQQGKLRVRVDVWRAIVAETEIPVEFMNGARLEPKPADCPAGSLVQLDCKSPYNYIGVFKESVRFEWSTTGVFGVLLGEGGQTHVISSTRTILYKANADAPEGASDTVTVSVYVDGKLKAQADTAVFISGIGLSLEPVRDPWAVPGTRKLIECEFTGERPEGELLYNWTCTSTLGSLWYPDPQENSVWYLANDGAKDSGTDEVAVELFVIQGGVKAPIGRAATTIEIYNPQTVYNLCGDSRGENFTKGSGSQWHYEIVGHGWVAGGFKARCGDKLRMLCIRKGVNTGDIYLRVGMVGTGPTSRTQLLLTDGQVYDGLDVTFEIQVC